MPDPLPRELPQDPLPLPWTELRQTLLTWYGQQGRDLPWRRSRDPYAIWISEIMLQQTQVKTVLPYFDRWMAQFATVEALAIADQQTVLKAWEGLGYYARARNLHRTAQILVAQYNAQFPSDLELAMALPGIGRTTAGGILSAAFNLPTPILDGNVKRVLARLIALNRSPNQALTTLWQLSARLLSPDHPRDFNQAIMDLGATVCTRHQPACEKCPWIAHCKAYTCDLTATLPMPESRVPLACKIIGVAVIRNDRDEILIDKRKQEGLLGGLWEFPGGKLEPNETIPKCIKREIREELAIEIKVGQELIVIDHAYTHFKVRLHVHLCEYLGGEPQPIACDEIRWVTLDDIDQFPFPKANTQIIEALKQLQAVSMT